MQTFPYHHTPHPLTKTRQQQSETMLRSGLLKAASRAATRVNNNNGALRFMSAKEIKFGVDGRTAMLHGVETLADAVQVRKK